MKVYKEKQYLIFDFEDGKTVKYDFAKKTAIGKSGKVVKDLCSQLSGYTINNLIADCVDVNYGRFLQFVKDGERRKNSASITNVGTVLSRVEKYANYEQFFSAGLDVLLDTGYRRFDFKSNFNDVPKSMIKVAHDHNLKINDTYIKYWKENIDAHYLAYQLEYESLDDIDIRHLLFTDYSEYDWTTHMHHYKSYFNVLVNEYGYNAKALMLYADDMKTFEAFNDMGHFIRELYDYARMMNEISNKFEKYPRNFLTTHQIASRNYRRLKEQFNEQKFQQRYVEEYNCKFDDYVFIYPKTTQDIKDEAVNQNNCVASYIQRVIDGNCHILFLRKKNNQKESLVTIEVVNNKIVQARGKFNRLCTEEELAIVDKFNKKFNKKNERKDAA